jgi:UDPglucose 6-dehydrogenase
VNPTTIATIGTGYVGLTSGACLAALGHQVTCVDRDAGKIDQLRDGIVPIHERGLDALVAETVAAGRLRFDTDTLAAAASHDVVLLCLPTPTGGDGGADLSAVLSVAEAIGPVLRPGTVVVTKSTVPVGTGRRVAAALGRDDVHVASNPEFLREGSAVDDFFRPDRVVVGANDDGTSERIAGLYATVDAPVLRTGLESAELIKYASNALLAIKLSFVNDLAALCERSGADVTEVTAGVGADARISERFLQPGPGWGGSCFPKDTRALAQASRQVGLGAELLDAAVDANDRQMQRIVDRTAELAGGDLAGRRVGLLGLTFKAGTDDLRESPALRIAELLEARGAEVHGYDPMVADDAALPVTAHTDPYSACRDADAVLVLTEWSEFAELDLDKLRDVAATDVIHDTRGVVDPEAAARASLELVTVGRGRA